MIKIHNLHATVSGKPILKGLDLRVKPGEIHAIMGPNGAGKSTLAKVLAGHPMYEITDGEVDFNGKNLLEMEPEERAHAGLFIGFQYPVEIAGVSNEQFLRVAYNSKRKAQGEPEISDADWVRLLDEKMAMMEMKAEFKARNLNEGFSGGEKKRNEILQMAVLNPQLAVLDETDSGLDIDAMRTVAKSLLTLMHKGMSLILITHYQRLLDYITPHMIHVMIGGRIVGSGGPDLAQQLEEKGYDWMEKTTVNS